MKNNESDYLNNRRTGLVKTLSGGQTFRQRFCPACWHWPKMKALNRAQQSFFFLDEGFGLR